MIYVTIEIRRVGGENEEGIIRDLRKVCESVTTNAEAGIVYECLTDDISKVEQVLYDYEKFGLAVDSVRSTKETAVYVISKWIGTRRILMSGQTQIMRPDGRVLTYANKREVAQDAPLHEKDTFENWRKRCSATSQSA